MRQHFKGVIWPRDSQDGTTVDGEQKIYRYAVVGMIVTDKPIEEFEGKNELFCDGPVVGMIEPFVKVNKREPNHRIGTANGVLTELNIL